MLWLLALVMANRLGAEFDHLFYLNVTVNSKLVTAIVDTGSSTAAFPCWGCLECNHRQIRPHTPPLGAYEQCYSEGSCNRGQRYEATFCFDAPERICFNHEFGCCTEYAPLFRTQRADGILGLSSDLMHKLNRRYVTFMITSTRAQMFFDLPDVHVRWTRPIVRVGRSEIPVLFDTGQSVSVISRRLHRGVEFDDDANDPIKCTPEQLTFRLRLENVVLHIDTFMTAGGWCAGLEQGPRMVLGINAFRNNIVVFDHRLERVGIARMGDFWPD